MFKTCMFCNRPLGTNEVIEHFPVGRRLAFDAERGRLWVVCRKCERWNLSPVEERWEAVEMCERLFRDTRVRVSTENVGLAKHPEGLELVRIGRPIRPEFAVWRYGDQFGRRRKGALLGTLAATAVFTGIMAGASSGWHRRRRAVVLLERLGQRTHAGQGADRRRASDQAHEPRLARYPSAVRELRTLRPYTRAAVQDAIERHLRHEPDRVSRSRIKRLHGLARP